MSSIRERMNAVDPDDASIAGLTVGAWLDRQDDGPLAKAAFRSSVEGLWCQPIGEIPLWYLIDNDRRITNEIFELQYFLGETMHALADDLARDLGDRLVLNAAVISIERNRSEVQVRTASKSFPARHVIVAVAPVMASRIGYAPPLSVRLVHALGVWRSGTVIKFEVRYDHSFWRTGV